MRLTSLLVVLLSLAGCLDGSPLSDKERRALLASSNIDSVFYAGTAAYRREDYADARALWERAVALGDPTAHGTLGYLLYYGLGGTEDRPRARYLWREGAQMGAVEAHTHLARIVLDGDSAGGNFTEAYAHAVAAVELGKRLDTKESRRVAELSVELKGRLLVRMTNGEVQRGDSMAADWTRVE